MKLEHTRGFDRDAYRASVDTMRARGETVHARGEEHRDRTGGLHPLVDIVGKPPRMSRNALVPGIKPGSVVLSKGVALPVLSMFDGTGSTSRYVSDFFHAAERQNNRLDGVRARYQPQMASAVVSDTYNVHANGLPVVQVSQFEPDERSAEQVRLLLPASMGNDTSTEDYQLGLFYGLLVEADIWEMYGLKGYFSLALDEIGRDRVSRSDMHRYLGLQADMPDMHIDEICQKLGDHWHLFILQVPTHDGSMLARTTSWWKERVGSSRVLQVEDPRLLADVRAALIYATEARFPTMDGLTEFFRTDNPGLQLNAAELNKVWKIIQTAGELFSAQTNLSGFDNIPLPGDVFAHYRHAYPTDHPLAHLNVTPPAE